MADPNFAPMYATRTLEGQDRSAGCPSAGRGLVAGGVPPGASPLGRAAARAGAPGGARCLGPDAHRIHRPDPGVAAPARLARGHGECGHVHPARAGAAAAGPPALGGALLAVMRPVNQQLAYSDEVIEAVTRPDARVQRLRTILSVGPVTAAAFVATIDDAGGFHRAHEVEAYLGLVPRELSSGESQRRGRITKAGNTRMRWLLVQAAVSIRACAIPGRPPCGVGPRASPRAAARRSPSSRWPAAWRASSMRCCATGRRIPHGLCRATRPRRPFRSEGRRMANAKLAGFENTQIAARVEGRDPGSSGRSRFTRVRLRTLSNRAQSAVR